MSFVPTVLIADPDPFILRALRHCLLLDGYEVRLARTGEQLESLMEVEPTPHLIVTEADLPVRSALDVIEGLRGRGDSTPVVLLTPTKTEALAARARDLQVRAVVLKPFDAEDLRSVVTLLLTRPARASDAGPA